MESTDSGETPKDLIFIHGIQIMRLWGMSELNLQHFILKEGLPAYKLCEDVPLLKDELQNYPTEKIPYLTFNRPDLIDLQADPDHKLPQTPIDSLPVFKNIDKEESDLYLKIRDLHDRNKLDRFDQTVSKELEKRKFEYYKKYKKDFSGVIDDVDWFRQIRLGFPPPLEIERDKDKERAIWNKHIKPIVKDYNLKNRYGVPFDYKFFKHPKTISQRDIDSMLRKTMAECDDLPVPIKENTYIFSDMVLFNLYNPKTEVYGTSLKNKFLKFLAKLFKEKELPVFLAFCDLEYTESEYAKNDTDKDTEKTNDIQKEAPKQKNKVFPCEPGTKWENVTITLTGDDTVRVKTLQGEGVFSYHQLELADGRIPSGKATMLWILLKLFCINNGFISPNTDDYDPKLPDTAKRLNKHLQKVFGIKESIYKDHYKKLKTLYKDPEKYPAQDVQTTTKSQRVKGYETEIFFSDQTKVVF
jgi:hypothetical protein